jgi:hypothetical protein
VTEVVALGARRGLWLIEVSDGKRSWLTTPARLGRADRLAAFTPDLPNLVV